MSRARIALLALPLAALLAGCGAAVDKVTEKAAEKAVEKAIESSADGDVNIERDGDGFSIETEDGSMSVDGEGNMVLETDEGTATIETGEELADDFPDIPLPDDLTIETTSRFADADGTVVHTVSGRVDRDAKDVFDELITQLEGVGYTADFRNDSTTDGEFFGTALATNTDGQQVSVNVITNDEGTIVQLSTTTLSN